MIELCAIIDDKFRYRQLLYDLTCWSFERVDLHSWICCLIIQQQQRLLIRYGTKSGNGENLVHNSGGWEYVNVDNLRRLKWWTSKTCFPRFQSLAIKANQFWKDSTFFRILIIPCLSRKDANECHFRRQRNSCWFVQNAWLSIHKSCRTAEPSLDNL